MFFDCTYLDISIFQFGEISSGGAVGGFSIFVIIFLKPFQDDIFFHTRKMLRGEKAEIILWYNRFEGILIAVDRLFRWSTRLYRSPGDSSLHDCSLLSPTHGVIHPPLLTARFFST